MKNRSKKTPIYVTQPSLPPLKDYVKLLEGVWESGILTHNGPLVQKFESQIIEKLGISNFVSVTNGTIAIQIAIKALGLKGEIITTPFSWIATISAIRWEGCEPVFCDIDPETLNMDPRRIECLITDKTVAIMPVHVFGNPCDVEEIDRIAKKYNLKVIYDAAHAVGTTLNNRSVLGWGDVSAISLHSTKLLNTAEGGGCITNDGQLAEKLRRIRFFGHDTEKNVIEDGINGKMTEVHAALGLANLKYYDDVLIDRKNKYDFYKNGLNKIRSISFQKLNGDGCNYSYFPVVFGSEKDLLIVESRLNDIRIFPRRYFYPSLNEYSKIVSYKCLPISEDVSRRILCLPLYKNLDFYNLKLIIKTIVDTLQG